MLVAVAALGTLGVVKLREGGEPPTTPSAPSSAVVATGPAGDAAIPDAPVSEPTVIERASLPVDAAPTAAPDAPGSTKSIPTKVKASAAAEPVASVELRNVTINVTPGWAYFTIDGDETQHETVKTVRLSPGPHRIHFSNPVMKVERSVTIEVPADRDLNHVERLGN
jgi:hypothetical protein